MDQKIVEFINSKVDDCLNAESFSSLGQEEKDSIKQKLTDHLYKVVIKTIISNLGQEELDELLKLDLESVEAEEKFEQFAAGSPGNIEKINETINKEVESIKQSGQVPASDKSEEPPKNNSW
jgi:hypothetical protein